MISFNIEFVKKSRCELCDFANKKDLKEQKPYCYHPSVIKIENGLCTTMKLKLDIELIPSARGKPNRNLHDAIPESWEQIATECKNKAGNKCEICGIVPSRGAKGGLHCHEIWSYDDKYHIQKLEGLIALCGMCHRVKHITQSIIGESYSFAKEYIPFEYVVLHFREVNNCYEEPYIREALEEYHRRSRYEWDIDFGKYAKQVQDYLRKNGRSVNRRKI